MPPKEEPSFPPPFECQMEQRGTGGCCGGSEWVNVTAHLDVAPDGQTLTLVIKGHHEDVEQGEKDYVVTHVDAFDDRRKYISLTGNFDNNETTCRFMKSDVKLQKWAANYKRFSRLKADRARVQNATKKTDYDTFNNSAGNTTSTDVNPIPEDPALSDPTGIMWVGTIFAHDKDNDGTINYDKPEEYNLEFDILVEHEDHEATSLEMTGDQIAAMCNNLIKAQILKRDKLFPKMMKMSTKEISFFLKPPKSPPGAPKVQVYCSAARYESLHTIIFILASEFTEKSACGGLVLDVLGGGDLGAGLLAKHFEEGCKGYTNKNPHPGNLFEGYNKQKRDAFQKALTERIKYRNDIYHENVRKAAENEEDLKKLKASLLQNMETIQDRSIKIKRNRKAAETMKANAGSLLKKAKVVESVACWKHCKWILCVSILITLILTGVVVFLYFYLKKK